MREITTLVLHHSLSTDNVVLADTNAIREWHLQKGWVDIGYHLVLEQLGNRPNAVIGRPWPEAGAHAPGHNKDSLGICLVGNFDLAPPSSALWEFAVLTCRWLMDVFVIDQEHVLGHTEATPNRTCPGRYFDLNKFRERL